jgi:hypothetical protein
MKVVFEKSKKIDVKYMYFFCSNTKSTILIVIHILRVLNECLRVEIYLKMETVVKDC